jgi:succinate dehydrogenase / fumarate reductase, cytochrome b subunit
MAQRERPLSPFMHYRWQYTNTLSILHRITGVLLSAAFFLLVYWLGAAAAGREQYAVAVACLASPVAQLLLAGTLFSFFYHLMMGIRHLAFDVGLGFELKTARRSGWAAASVALALTCIVWLALRGSLAGGA